LRANERTPCLIDKPRAVSTILRKNNIT